MQSLNDHVLQLKTMDSIAFHDFRQFVLQSERTGHPTCRLYCDRADELVGEWNGAFAHEDLNLSE
jgi:hypothetical protein